MDTKACLQSGSVLLDVTVYPASERAAPSYSLSVTFILFFVLMLTLNQGVFLGLILSNKRWENLASQSFIAISYVVYSVLALIVISKTLKRITQNSACLSRTH